MIPLDCKEGPQEQQKSMSYWMHEEAEYKVDQSQMGRQYGEQM